MNPPVFGSYLSRWMRTLPKPQARQPILSMAAKCDRKGHRPPNKDGFCTRCRQPIIIAGELLELGDVIAVEAGIARKL